MFIGSSISTSPTIAGVAGAAISKGAGKAMKFDASGNVVPCSVAGETAIGILILQTADEVAQGDSVTVQVSCRGKGIAGGVIAAGDLLTVDDSGKLVKANDGNYIIGQALEAATAGGLFLMDVFKGGKA